MRNYIRSTVSGGTYFFTVNLAERRNNDLLIRYIDILRKTVSETKRKHPFQIDGFVILPEHLHAIWTLPKGDSNYSTRWRLIKSTFSRNIPKTERISNSRQHKNERGIWQRRFWEHTIRDDKDFENHMDYLPPRIINGTRQTRLCEIGGGLGIFHLSSLGQTRCLFSRLGW